MLEARRHDAFDSILVWRGSEVVKENMRLGAPASHLESFSDIRPKTKGSARTNRSTSRGVEHRSSSSHGLRELWHGDCSWVGSMHATTIHWSVQSSVTHSSVHPSIIASAQPGSSQSATGVHSTHRGAAAFSVAAVGGSKPSADACRTVETDRPAPGQAFIACWGRFGVATVDRSSDTAVYGSSRGDDRALRVRWGRMAPIREEEEGGEFAVEFITVEVTGRGQSR